MLSAKNSYLSWLLLSLVLAILSLVSVKVFSYVHCRLAYLESVFFLDVFLEKYCEGSMLDRELSSTRFTIFGLIKVPALMWMNVHVCNHVVLMYFEVQTSRCVCV